MKRLFEDRNELASRLRDENPKLSKDGALILAEVHCQFDAVIGRKWEEIEKELKAKQKCPISIKIKIDTSASPREVDTKFKVSQDPIEDEEFGELPDAAALDLFDKPDKTKKGKKKNAGEGEGILDD